MQDVNQLQLALRRGDKVMIAHLTNSSLDMVIKVLKGERSANGTKGELIIRTAKAIIRQRQSLERRLKES